MLTRWIAFHFAGGDAFFAGIALMLLAILMRIRSQGRWRRAAGGLSIVAVAWIVLSATPMSLVMAAIALALWIAWLAQRPAAPRFRQLRLAAALGCAALMLAGFEAAYRFSPPVPERVAALAVIGDSISAGMLGPSERTWPKRFEEIYGLPVEDASAEGAMVSSALKQAAQLNARKLPQDTTVLIEIGGNDFFGSTSAADFEIALSKLLEQTRGPDRSIIMLELPLPPLYNRFGAIQRRLAAQFGVPMISRRRFAGVIFSEDATRDGLHLSDRGHELMARMIGDAVGLKPAEVPLEVR